MLIGYIKSSYLFFKVPSSCFSLVGEGHRIPRFKIRFLTVKKYQNLNGKILYILVMGDLTSVPLGFGCFLFLFFLFFVAVAIIIQK